MGDKECQKAEVVENTSEVGVGIYWVESCEDMLLYSSRSCLVFLVSLVMLVERRLAVFSPSERMFLLY